MFTLIRLPHRKYDARNQLYTTELYLKYHISTRFIICMHPLFKCTHRWCTDFPFTIAEHDLFPVRKLVFQKKIMWENSSFKKNNSPKSQLHSDREFFIIWNIKNQKRGGEGENKFPFSDLQFRISSSTKKKRSRKSAIARILIKTQMNSTRSSRWLTWTFRRLLFPVCLLFSFVTPSL